MRRVWGLLKTTYTEWDRHNASNLGAGIAYFSILSLAPLLVVVLAITGFVLGPKIAEGHLMAQFQSTVGVEGADAIENIISHANHPKAGLVASIIGLVTLFLGASGVFTMLHDALNIIWDVTPKKGSHFWGMLRQRLLSFGMVLSIGLLLLISLVVSAGVAAADSLVRQLLPLPAFVLELANSLVSVAVISLLFALIYRFLPDERVEWRDVWIGAFATAVMFTLGKSLIGLYLGKVSVGSAYGAAGSLVVVLVWVYYSAQIFLFGAEFTHVYANDRSKAA